MTTAHLALRQIVNGPLHFREQWGEMLGKFDSAKWLTVLFAGVILALNIGQITFGAGGLFSGQTKDVQGLQLQVSAVQKQQDIMAAQMAEMKTNMAPLLRLPSSIDRLADRLDASPRSDLLNSQLSEIQHHLSVQDGRFDSDEIRQRNYEEKVIRDDSRLDAIENASKATLGNHR